MRSSYTSQTDRIEFSTALPTSSLSNKPRHQPQSCDGCRHWNVQTFTSRITSEKTRNHANPAGRNKNGGALPFGTYLTHDFPSSFHGSVKPAKSCMHKPRKVAPFLTSVHNESRRKINQSNLSHRHRQQRSNRATRCEKFFICSLQYLPPDG